MSTVTKQSNIVKLEIGTYKNVIDEAIGSITKDTTEQCNLVNIVLKQLTETYFSNDNLQEVAENILSHINSIKPQDHIELMLVTQMIATHNAAMRNFQLSVRRSGRSEYKSLELGNANLNLANKLMRTYTTQIEALNRYRGKGQQKMTIEHVNINSGGQAVIGNLASTKKVEV
jgi:hypothetical protein